MEGAQGKPSGLRFGNGFGLRFRRWFPVSVSVWASISTSMWPSMSVVPFAFGFFALKITAAFSAHSAHLLRSMLEALLVLGYQLVQGLHRLCSAFRGGNGTDGFETRNAFVEGVFHHVCPTAAPRSVGVARPTDIGVCQRACVGIARLQGRPSAVSSASPVALFLRRSDADSSEDDAHNDSGN
jgi:hypothetical protein